MNRLARVAFTVVAVLLIVLTLLRVARSWTNDSHLEHVAGAWIALAVDLKEGVFYRPPYGAHGYGGTRFFPLYFVLHGAATKVVGTWRAPGYILSSASILLLLLGCYRLLRRLGTNPWLSFAGVVAVLAASSVQDSLLTIREDGMAAMFNVWGILVCCSGELSNRRLFFAALLFGLAFATKESSVFGVATSVLWLVFAGKQRTAVRLAVTTGVGFLLVLGGIYVGSGGQAFQVFRETLASGGGLRTLFSSPEALLGTIPGYWAETILLALALATLISRPLAELRSLPALLFGCTLLVTLVIISSPGAAGNHLLDLHVAAVVLFISAIAEWSPDFCTGVCSVAALVAFVSFLPVYREVDSVPLKDNYQDIVEAIGFTDRPILADNPLVPIIAGQQPYVMDAFMFRVLAENNSDFAQPLWRMIDDKDFAAIVLQDNPDSDDGKEVYTHYHFGGEFLNHLHKNYQPAGTPGDHYLFLPKR